MERWNERDLTDEKIMCEFDWESSQEDFKKQVKNAIYQLASHGKVLALPLEIHPGQVGVDMLTLLLAQVNCEGCDARCCKQNPQGTPMDILPSEYERLVKMYGPLRVIREGNKLSIRMPCPFLKARRCSIYPNRPLVCVLYPFQPGGTNGDEAQLLALASTCPEGKRIAKAIFMTGWRIRHQFRLLGKEDFGKGTVGLSGRERS